jgi:hypothetical protein
MPKLVVLEYQGKKLLFNSLSQASKEELLNIEGNPFSEIPKNAASIAFFLEKGYLPFKDNYTGDRMVKITENKKGKFIRISDNVIHLNKILAVCEFCKTHEGNDIVKRTTTRNQLIAVFKEDFYGIKEGKEISYVGKLISTPLGDLNAKKFEETGIVELKSVPIYNGNFDRNQDGYYNTSTDIRFLGNKVEIGCQTFITSSLTKLAKPLREYLGK